jgi:uncharacterized membrane protein YdbT with pleckstrin-like domain
MHQMTPHQEEAASRLIEFDDDEELLLEIRKHPFGLFIRVLTGLISIGIIFGMALILNMSLSDGTLGNDASFAGAIIGIASIVAIFAVIAIILVIIVYVNDVIFVTSEKIAQVLYKNIITRKVSQLNIGDVQDVTVRQNGIFARIFNYGTLVIETAGEQNNYIFPYVPDPNRASQIIIGAHEKNVALFGN